MKKIKRRQIIRFLGALLALSAILFLSLGFQSTENLKASDPNMKLLLHMDGTNGSTAFTDSSSSAHSVTAIGNAQLSTANKKFGTASGLFDGSGDQLRLADSSDWYFGTGDLTIDFWIYFNTLPSGGGLVDIADQWEDSVNGWFLSLTNGFAGMTGWAIAENYHGAAAFPYTSQGSFTTLANQWYHVALVRSGTSFKIYVNGNSVTSGTTSAEMHDFASPLTIGGENLYSGRDVDGYIDEFRILKGEAAWTSNFTPPAGPYNTNFPPTGVFNSASQESNGTGKVDVSVTVNDPDNDNSKAKVEYTSDVSCTSGWAKATLISPVTASVGSPPDIQNAQAYQLGNTTPISTTSANTVTFIWDSHTDIPTGNGTYCLRLTANDGTVDQTTPATRTTAIDNVAPSVVLSSTASDPTGTSPIPVTATFSESVGASFILTDITVGNGIASGLAGGPAVYTFNVAPTNPGPVTVDINAGVAQDLAGNGNTAATQLSRTFLALPVSSFTATSAGMRITLNWSPPASLTPNGYVILRKSGSPPTTNSLPDGSGPYIVGNTVGGDLIVYSNNGVGPNAPPINDNNVNDSAYFYKIFAHYSNGKYSNSLSANATAVAENVNGYSATSDGTPKVTLFSSVPGHTTNLQQYLIWKKTVASCAGTWVPSDGVSYSISQAIGGGTIIDILGVPPNNYNDLSVSGGVTYCYKVFVQYSGESSGSIYSDGSSQTVTPPNNPPQVQITNVTQTLGTENVVIQYEVRDKDVQGVNVAFNMNGPCVGAIGTAGPIAAVDAWSAVQTYNWNGVATLCANQESSTAQIIATVSDGTDTGTDTYSRFTFDTKNPTLPSPSSGFDLVLQSTASDSVSFTLSSNPYFLSPIDQDPLGSSNTYQIFYASGGSVSDTTGIPIDHFDSFTLGKSYTVSGLNPSQQYTFNIWSYDAYGHKIAAPDPLTVTTGVANSAPSIAFTAQPAQQSGGGNVTFNFHYSDPDSDGLTVSSSLVNSPPGCSISSVSGFTNPLSSSPSWADANATWNALVDCGNQDISIPDVFKIEITANDGHGHNTSVDSNPFALDTKNPNPAPGNLLVTANIFNQSEITLSSTAGSDTNASVWKIYRVTGDIFPADPTSLTAIQSYIAYPGAVTIHDLGLTSGLDYTYNICLFDTFNNHTCAVPQTVTTQSLSLFFSISGVASGQTVGPESTTVTTTSNSIPFGDVVLGSSQVGALVLHGSSNLTAGYTIDVREDTDLISGSNTISPFSASNAMPSFWPVSPITSILGYSSLNLARFSGGSKWAGFTTSSEPIIVQSSDGVFDDDFLVKLTTDNSQPAGNYTNTVIFSIIANP